MMRFKIFVLIFFVCSCCAVAINCPDGRPQLKYEVTNPEGSLQKNQKNPPKGAWDWSANVKVKMTLNCDSDPCITEIAGSIEVWAYDSEAHEFRRLYSGGEKEGVEPGTCNLCEEGESFEFAIITDAQRDAYEPLYIETDF